MRCDDDVDMNIRMDRRMPMCLSSVMQSDDASLWSDDRCEQLNDALIWRFVCVNVMSVNEIR